jgi:hypothetical protein
MTYTQILFIIIIITIIIITTTTTNEINTNSIFGMTKMEGWNSISD